MKIKKAALLLICFCFILTGINADLTCIYADDEDTAYASGDAVQIEEQFDTKSGMYTQTLGRGLEFMSSVPNGSVVSDGVYFEMPSNIETQLQRDGEYITFANKTAMTAAGYYILRLSGTDMYGSQVTGVFTFRVGLPPSGGVKTSEYKYPKISTAAVSVYDDSTGMNKYTFPNYKAFFASFSSDESEVESASFLIPGNLGYNFKRNGADVGYMENKVYTQPGNYVLKVYDYSYASDGGYAACYETVLKFSIADESRESVSETIGNEISSFISSGGESVSNAIESIGDKLEEEENKVIADSLSENYYDSANIYSQTFSTGDSFYTNIANDAIVGGNVYFDLPYNMTAVLTKDGAAVEFKNKSYINTAGSYVLTVTDDFDDVTSEAKFSFRIQPGTESADDISKTEGGSEDENGDGSDEDSDEIDADYDVANEYDADRGMYVFKCGSDNVYMSVPDGGITNYEVKIDVSDEVEKSLKINDEEVGYESSLNQDGSYVLDLKNGDDTLTLKFYIVSEPVNFLDEVVMPEGYSLLVAEYNDYMGIYSEDDLEYLDGLDEIEQQNKDYASVFSLPLDGEYDFIMQGRSGMPIISFSAFIDRIAPEVKFDGLDDKMSTQEESVIISCDEEDAVVTLTDSKGEESELDLSDGVVQISGKGKFTLTVSDKAGNKNTYDFTLGKSAAAGKVKVIIILVLLVLILAAVVIVVIKIFKGTLFGGKSGKKDKKEKKEKKEKNGEKGSLLDKLKPIKDVLKGLLPAAKTGSRVKSGRSADSQKEAAAESSGGYTGGLDFSDAEEDSYLGGGLDFSDAEEDGYTGGGLDFSDAEEDGYTGGGLDFSDTEEDSYDDGSGMIGGRLNFNVSDDTDDENEDEDW